MEFDSNPRLSRIDVLHELSREELLSIERRCRWRRCGRGQLVIDHQGSDRDVYFLVEGTVRATVYSHSGREVTFADIDAGGCFGDLSAIDGRPRSASVVALTDVNLASMPPQLFWEIVIEQPAFATSMLKHLAGIVRRLDDRVVEFSTLGVQNRIHAELLRLAKAGSAHQGAAVISPVPRHADIASRVSTNREAVTRELNHLARKGILARLPGQLVIQDLQRLARMVDESRDA
jgi:CRP-like cAMP-binding protein